MSEPDDIGVHEKRPSLIGTSGRLQGRVVKLSSGVRLGRHSRNDVCLDDHTVSSFHTEITVVNGEYEIVDLGSKNGTKLNGRRIRHPVPLADNDVIEIGKNTLRFRLPQTVGPDPTTGVRDGCIRRTSDRRPCSSEAITLGREPRGHSAPGPMGPDKTEDPDISSVNATAKATCHQAPGLMSVKHTKARRSVVNVVLYSLPAFLVGLVVAGLILAKLPLHAPPGSSQEDMLSAGDSQRNHEVHSASLRPIWTKWESTSMREPAGTVDIRALLDQALSEDDRMRGSTPDARWRLYKTCLGLVQAAQNEPEDSELRRQAEQLLLRVKIEIEDEEQSFRKRLSRAREAGQYGTALELLRHVTQLMDLEQDNRESELARRCAALEQEITREQTTAGGA